MNSPFDNNQAITTADIAHGETVDAERRLPSVGGAQAAKEPQKAPHFDPLFATGEAQDLRTRWDSIQTAFVDEPRKSVESADNLVAATIKRLAEIFADERSKLEAQWGRGDNVSTEDLRVALQRYRSFFTRLLSV
jgi:hypothetical protein